MDNAATNVLSVRAAGTLPLDELCDCDVSVQSFKKPNFEVNTTTTNPTERLSLFNATDDMEMIQDTEPKRRKLDMGDLMVRTNITKRTGSGKPFNQFKAPKRPEISRLSAHHENETGTPTTVKAFGRAGFRQPLVADLIRLRENESRLFRN
jgi:hypothetical protein